VTDQYSLATLGLFFIPESPRWYVARGKIDQAKKALGRLNGKVKDYNIEHELAIITKEVEDGQKMTNNAKTYSVWEVFKGTNLVRGFFRFLNWKLTGLIASNFDFVLVS
jgi:hypothetical protein